MFPDAGVTARSLCHLLVGLILLAAEHPGLAAEPQPFIVLAGATNRVAKYGKLEFNVGVPRAYTNAFDPEEVDITVAFTAPGGEVAKVPAFWCQPYERRRLRSGERWRDWFYPAGDPAWKVRFAPSETGSYEAAATLRDKWGTAISTRIRFECVPSISKGYLRVSRKDPRFLEFSEGDPFFAIGQNLAFIGEQQFVGLSKAEEIFGRLAENGANYLRIWTCCDDWALAIEARKSAFGRSWDWRPAIVPAPDAGSSGRKCLALTAEKNVLRIDPSHPVAVRSGTRYVFSGRARLGSGSTLRLEVGRTAVAATTGASSPPEWKSFNYEFSTGPSDDWLPPLSLRFEGQGDCQVDDLSLKEAGGGPELLWEAEVNRRTRGYYNPLDCYLLDELLAAAEQKQIYLQLCLLTRDLYMGALKEANAEDYERAIRDARKTLRYAVARWGYSTAVAAWEYWNEMDPGLPTDRFYAALGDYLAQADPYHHLRTTSTWGPSAKDCRHPKLDLADAHFYLRPSDKGRLQDEVDAVIERTGWLREQAPAKPVHLGEFGLANEKWQPRPETTGSREIADLHNALWASALSGASGTAMFWWWERLDQRDFYPHYWPLSQFIARVPWTGGDLRPVAPKCSEGRVRVVGLRSGGRAWLWLFNREAAWGRIVLEKRHPAVVSKVEIELADWPEGRFTVRWWDTREAKVLRQEKVASVPGTLRFSAPDFAHDVACEVGPDASASP